MNPRWTAEEDSVLQYMWGICSLKEICDELGRSVSGVTNRRLKLGIYVRPLHKPSKEAWHAMASQTAKELGIKPESVIGLRRFRAAVLARQMACERLMETGKYSVAGLARTMGVHHTTVLCALGRTGRKKAQYVSGYPVDNQENDLQTA